MKTCRVVSAVWKQERLYYFHQLSTQLHKFISSCTLSRFVPVLRVHKLFRHSASLPLKIKTIDFVFILVSDACLTVPSWNRFSCCSWRWISLWAHSGANAGYWIARLWKRMHSSQKVFSLCRMIKLELAGHRFHLSATSCRKPEPGNDLSPSEGSGHRSARQR